MTMIDNGVQGAKRQSTKTNPMPIVMRILEARGRGVDPYDDKLRKQFEKEIEDHEDRDELMTVIMEYYWTNAVHRCTKAVPTVEERAAKKKLSQDRIERTKHEMSMKLDAKVQNMFLDMVMANGKTLRECTRKELVVLHTRQNKVIDGILRTLKKPGQTVGSVFKTNDDLNVFLKRSK